jgi:hypothetical protein
MQDLWQSFFSLQTIKGLKELLNSLDPAIPAHASLLHYSESWQDALASLDSAEFNPSSYLSSDRSAIMLGSCPVLFMGTNQWAEKPHADCLQHSKAMSRFISNLERLRETYRNQRVAVVVVPEKDYVINRMFIGAGRYESIDESLESVKHKIARLDMELIYNCTLEGLDGYMEISDFEYSDSHLASANYIQIFCRICKAFGLNHNEIHAQMSMAESDVYGDLCGRFLDTLIVPRRMFLPYYPSAIISLIDGSKSFESPLGNTWQRLLNQNPIVEGGVLILGDSHSSICDERRLTYLASGAFRSTEFFWNPCGVRSALPETSSEYVILEISCRFLF